MSGISDRVLSKQQLRTLQGRSDLKGWERLGIHAGLLTAAGWLVAVSSGWMVLPAVFVLGLVQVALFAPAHETMHQTAFASRRANAIVGWLTSCPSLLNWHFYTAFHLAHHRHTQVRGLDPELMAETPATVRGYVLRVLGVPFWTLRLRVVWDCWRGDLEAYPFVSVAAAPKIVRSVRAMTLIMVGGAAAAGLVFGWATPLLYWIGPQLLGQPPLRAYLLAEHTGCTRRSEWVDQYSDHADLRAGPAVDVGDALPCRASFVSVDPVSPVGRCAWADPGKAGCPAAGLCALECRVCAIADGAVSLAIDGSLRQQ